MRKTDHERNKKIADAYASAEFTTEHIAAVFRLSRRRIEQIAAEHGVIRTQAEGNRVATPLKSKRRIRLR